MNHRGRRERLDRLASISSTLRHSAPAAPDLTDSILDRVDQKRAFLTRAERRKIWFTRLLTASSIACVALGVALFHRFFPDLISFSPQTAPMTSVLSSVADQAQKKVVEFQTSLYQTNQAPSISSIVAQAATRSDQQTFTDASREIPTTDVLDALASARFLDETHHDTQSPLTVASFVGPIRIRDSSPSFGTDTLSTHGVFLSLNALEHASPSHSPASSNPQARESDPEMFSTDWPMHAIHDRSTNDLSSGIRDSRTINAAYLSAQLSNLQPIDFSKPGKLRLQSWPTSINQNIPTFLKPFKQHQPTTDSIEPDAIVP